MKGNVSRSGRRHRLVGALLGAGLPAVIGAVAVAAGGRLEPLPFVAAWGVPVGALLGWLAGPRAARAASAGEWLGITFGIAGAAVVLGAIEVGATVALLGGFTGAGDPISAFLFGLLVLPFFGIVIFGLPALVAIVPIALTWSALVRVIARRDDVSV